jgi:hypothetical protein
MAVIRQLILIILLGASGSAAASAAPSPTWNPANTYAVIVGVLHWQDNKLTSYPTENRQDEALYRTLLQRGVPGAHVRLLLDDQATLANIRLALTEVAAAAPPDSTLIFYYAGHGLKRGKKETYFANYDLQNDHVETTGLNLKDISRILEKNFKGRNVWLMADCCYSGSLEQVVDAMARQGKAAMSLTSADAIDTSTGNWTFTETVIEGLRGQTATLSELERSVGRAMKCREHQRYGFYSKGWLPETMMASAANPKKNQKDPCAGVVFKHYPAGALVMVDWMGTDYLAKVVKHDGDFHYITYPGWPASNDEWVTFKRIKGVAPAHAAANNRGSVLVEWHDRWYPAQILKQDGRRYFIRYSGYDASWDEWVGPERIRRIH